MVAVDQTVLNEQRVWSVVPTVQNEILDMELQSVLKVVSFNVPTGGSPDWRDGWAYRRDMVAEFVRHHDLDVICFQEPHEYQTREIASRLPEYAYFGRGRNRDGSSEYQPIFWKKNRFSQLNNGCFWLSETPHVPESMGWDAVCTRQTVWTILHDTQSMRDILFLNTHWDHVGITARTSSARVINSQTESILRENKNVSAVILSGDFNDEYQSPGVSSLELKWANSSNVQYFGNNFTFVGWKKEFAAIIDYIFFRGEGIRYVPVFASHKGPSKNILKHNSGENGLS